MSEGSAATPPIVPPITSREQAEAADRNDPLAFVRDRFDLPPGVIYLDGNSLGPLPHGVAAAVADVVQRQWGADLITSWNRNGWWTLPARLGDRIGALVGAGAGQVLCGDSTSIQLFQAITALARLRPQRRTLVTDGANFPTDQYLADAAAALLDMQVVRVSPAEVSGALGEDTAVVSFSAVDYRTGVRWDAGAITEQVHGAGALMLWDLAHVAGAMPFALDDIGADAAVGCSYKYLNGGPGAPAWLYLARRHQDAVLPLTGWQGAANPFALEQHYLPAPGIERARIGTPSILGMAALNAALGVWDGVDLSVLRTKSLALSDVVIAYTDEHLATYGVQVVTPRDHARRGSQVSLQMAHGYEVTQALIARGVIGDFRAPDLLRLGLPASYLRYVEVWDALEQLRDVLATEAYTAPEFARNEAAPVT
ncbi:MAG TPA: aminotransferase class V-fold PLP-dependent enzyme [Jatrophihabitantaceae bacterium]